MSTEPSVIIIGAGLSGVQTAESLRTAGFVGTIKLLGDEPHLPYHRPPLSKAWLAGEIGAEQLIMRTSEALARKNIVLQLNSSVLSIDTNEQTVVLANGELLRYSGLAITTGASPRGLPIKGANLPRVLALRSRDDASIIAERMAECAEKSWPIVVIGGGFIGLEVAATARKKNIAVTVLEAAPRLLGRALAPALSDWYFALHKSHGVQLLLNAKVNSIEEDNSGAASPLQVHMNDGTIYPAGLVLVGIGVNANDGLAKTAGIDCDRGIIVDICSRTSAKNVVAAGDCTARRLPDGSLLRLESVQNATEQGKSAASALLGHERLFTATPWFWSDQYDKKLQMAGLSIGADEWVVRGNMDSGNFSVFHISVGKLIAVDSINSTKEHLQARKLIELGLSPTKVQMIDVAFDLSSLLVQ